MSPLKTVWPSVLKRDDEIYWPIENQGVHMLDSHEFDNPAYALDN